MPGTLASVSLLHSCVGAADKEFGVRLPAGCNGCRYGQSYWEESIGGSEVLSKEKVKAAFGELIKK